MLTKIKNIIKKYKHSWAMIYTLIYFPWFTYLEHTIVSSYHIMHCPIDDMIPFNEYFIIAYYFWFIYIFFALFFFIFTDRDEFYRYGFFLALGMSICLFICQIFPNGTQLRPVIDPAKNWACRLVASLYKIDTPTNVFPSMHVYNSIGTHIAFCRSKYFHDKPVIKGFSLLSLVMITLSTLFLKQHSILDVAGAGILAYFMFHAVYAKTPIPTVSLELFGKKEKNDKAYIS